MQIALIGVVWIETREKHSFSHNNYNSLFVITDNDQS